MSSDDRDDLAAMFASISRRLAEAEGPLLEARGLTMWEYVVLSRLTRGPADSQLTLAREIRHDKTRLIRVLDGLQHRGLIERESDPADRRSRTVAITHAGRDLHASVRGDIRQMEDGVLDVLTADERRVLLVALPTLNAPEVTATEPTEHGVLGDGPEPYKPT